MKMLHLQSVRLEIPASVVMGTLGISPFIVDLCRPSLQMGFTSCCLQKKNKLHQKEKQHTN